jgi:general secretion pathway protein I
MVALSLLAVALMAVADLAGNALRNHAYARDLTTATLLARGKMAEAVQKYEDEGFRDFDEQEDGDFSEEGRPGMRWRLELVKPSSDLSADQLVAVVAGAGGDAQDLIAKLMAGAPTEGQGGAPASPVAAANPMAGMLGGLLQSQLTVLGETLKKSFREMRLTVTWRDGRIERGFTVTTHLLVLNPKAPGGARGDNPEGPANLSSSGITSTEQMPGGAKAASDEEGKK